MLFTFVICGMIDSFDDKRQSLNKTKMNLNMKFCGSPVIMEIYCISNKNGN